MEAYVGLQAIDEGTSFALERLHQDGLNQAMAAITHLGDQWVIFGLVGLASIVFAWKRRIGSALILIIISAIAYWGFTSGTKYLIPRKRPDLPNPIVTIPATRSFPSGHALNSAAAYMVIALMATRQKPWRLPKLLIIGGTFFLIILIGFTRIFLCVHWLSDVLAGWSAGFGLALIALWADINWTSLPALGAPHEASPRSE
jgi:undecaprenyl-diphosphatase